MPEIERMSARELLEQIDRHGRRARRMLQSPEDRRLLQDVKRLCERWDYGAVMDAVAALWFGRDPVGALTVGPAAKTVREVLDGRDTLGGEKNA